MYIQSITHELIQNHLVYSNNFQANPLQLQVAMDRPLLVSEFEDIGLTISDDMIDECEYIINSRL